MHYAENTWIGVGLDDQTIYTSDDAVYWVKRYAAADALKDVTFGNGTFVAVGDNGLVLQSAVILKEALRISGTDSPSLRLTMLRGRHYRLESSPDLEAWELVQEFTGSGATEDIDVIPASDKAFYRLTLSGD